MTDTNITSDATLCRLSMLYIKMLHNWRDETDPMPRLTVRERILLDLIAMDNDQLYKAMSPEATMLLEDCQCEDCVMAHGTCVSTDKNGFQPCQLDTMDYMDMPTARRHIILPDDGDAAP